ncbi:alpha/beta fold hydrolase [Brackiella oedipodis]|uniref:alpha/beta fold hydrolase n=1 Tax=Brackiella oedipodis TaxID=124225 RepID=UPI00056E4295|nr:alpha/beta hydrolase [Brackiella oedipodis]
MPATDDFPIQYITLPQGVEYAYIDQGQGEVLLLIHGSMVDHRFWRWQIPALSQHYRVIAPSLRHYWPIPMEVNSADFSSEQHAKDMAELLRALGISKAHVLGHSRAGGVAVKVAHLAPELTKSLILADPSIRTPDEVKQIKDWLQHSWDLIQTQGLESGLANFIDNVSGKDTWDRMVEWFKQMVRDNAHTLAMQRLEEPTLFKEDKLKAIAKRCPISLIGGGISPDPYPEILQALQNLIPEATLNFVDKATHGMNLSHPNKFNQLVLEHLQKYA